MTVAAIRESWAVLQELQANDLRVRILDAEGGQRLQAIGVGLDAAGRRHLLIPVDQDRRIVEDKRSAGVQITRHLLVDGTEQRAYVDVICLKAYLGEIFDVLADEMVTEANAQPDQPDLACRRVLEKWRDLIEHEAGQQAGPERLAALFGELWHLRELFRLDPVRALAAWVGPSGARHDFMGPTTSLEVKASLSRQGRFPEIHSLEQLQPPAAGDLYLAMMRLERTASGHTVGSLASEIGDLGADRQQLHSRMQQAGFDANDLAVDHPTRFSVVENRLYLVDSSFPAITPQSFVGGIVPPGVIRVQYLIDLSTEVPKPLDPEMSPEVHRRLLS